MNSLFLKFWILLHVLVAGFALHGMPWKIEANLTEIAGESKAEKLWMKNNSSSFAILVGHANFDAAKKAAIDLYNSFSQDSSLANLELFIDDSAIDDLRSFFFRYRYHLRMPGSVEKIKEQALARIYGFSMANLENLESDPFLLGESGFFEMANFSNLKIADDMRVAELNGINYILLTGSLSPNVFSIASDGHVLGRIKDRAKLHPDVQFAFSGIPFHTYESSGNAKREITVIASISMALIVLLIIYAFRSPFPLFAMLGMILTAIVFAASATWLVFGQIHILTFVFGTSLIGISTDYALHFFTHWKAGGKSGQEVRRQIISCISLSFLTTMLGYAALMLTPFLLLRQMALFSFMGLLSTFLTVQILFPYVKPSKKSQLPFSLAGKILAAGKYISKFKIPILAATFIFAIFGFMRVQFKNDITTFYSMSNEMKQSEYLTAQVMNSGSGVFYIVQGSTLEDMLINEEALCSQLDSTGSYLALTSFLPSVKTQRKIYSYMEENLLSPADSMLLELNFDSSAIGKMRSDFAKSKDDFLTDISQLPSAFRQMAERLWLGEIDGTYYSVVVPSRYAAVSMPNVHFIDKVSSVDAELTGISKMALLLMFAVYFFVFALLCFLYGFKTALGIAAVPVLSVITAISFISAFNLPLTFFTVSGLILTLAIGIDYALFFAKGKGSLPVISLGIFFSMLTTLLSFGVLAFSSFAPVSMFGLAAFLGIFGCFFFTILFPYENY